MNRKDRLCRNITIYGYCKFENQGCEFNHTVPQANQPNQDANAGTISSKVRLSNPEGFSNEPANPGSSVSIPTLDQQPAFEPELLNTSQFGSNSAGYQSGSQLGPSTISGSGTLYNQPQSSFSNNNSMDIGSIGTNSLSN
jgi:hypothetical protein